MQFQKVEIFDPHSKVALDLIYKSKAKYPVEEVMGVAFKLRIDLFCYPDDGAYDKYTGYGDVQQEIYDYPCIRGKKTRDQSTGYITDYKIEGNVEGKKVLIVDDLIDGGMTFILLTKELLTRGAKEVNLYASHGIFSKGLKPLFESGIKRIFTKDGEASEVQNQICYKEL